MTSSAQGRIADRVEVGQSGRGRRRSSGVERPRKHLNVRESAPLLFAGGAGLLLALVLFQESSQFRSYKLPLWPLSLAIGLVALAGGLIALFAGDFLSSGPNGGGPGSSQDVLAPVGGRPQDGGRPRPTVDGGVAAQKGPPPPPAFAGEISSFGLAAGSVNAPERRVPSMPEPTSPPSAGGMQDFVTIPRAEWEALRSSRRPGDRSASLPQEPPWWEGPPERRTAPPADHPGPLATRERAGPSPVQPTSVVSPTPSASPVSRKSADGAARSATAPRVPTRAPLTAAAAPPVSRRGFPKEFMDALAELEGRARQDIKVSPRRSSTTGPAELRSCADCKRDMAGDRSPSRCSDCGRALCVDCALSSQMEDGELRCVKCRVRRP
jgi:hypothetical protein